MASKSFTVYFAFIASAVAFQYGDIRLADTNTVSTNPDLGRLEVYFNGTWLSVCYDIDHEKIGFAKVACGQLGYKSWMIIGTAEKLNFTRGTESALLYYVHCPNKKDSRDAPLHILRCDVLKESPSGLECPTANHIVLECDDKDSIEEDAYDTMVGFYNDSIVDIIKNEDATAVDFYDGTDENEFSDLFDSADYPKSVSSGLVKVYLNGAWGPVCNMHHEAAESFCRQLGFTNVSKVQEVAVEWIEGSQPAEVLDSFNCAESYSCLRECFDYPAPSAPVNCSGKFSEVTCLFDELITNDYGTKSACTSSISGIVAASVVGSLVFVAVVVTIATVLACFLLQGCKWRGRKLLITETSGGGKYKSF